MERKASLSPSSFYVNEAPPKISNREKDKNKCEHAAIFVTSRPKLVSFHFPNISHLIQFFQVRNEGGRKMRRLFSFEIFQLGFFCVRLITYELIQKTRSYNDVTFMTKRFIFSEREKPLENRLFILRQQTINWRLEFDFLGAKAAPTNRLNEASSAPSYLYYITKKKDF